MLSEMCKSLPGLEAAYESGVGLGNGTTEGAELDAVPIMYLPGFMKVVVKARILAEREAHTVFSLSQADTAREFEMRMNRVLGTDHANVMTFPEFLIAVARCGLRKYALLHCSVEEKILKAIQRVAGVGAM